LSNLFSVLPIPKEERIACQKSRSPNFQLSLNAANQFFPAIVAPRARETVQQVLRFSGAPRRVRKEYHREKRRREKEREKSMKKKKMLIGAACSVQQRMLTRLPGTWRAFSSLSLSCLFGPRGRIPFSRRFRLDAGFPQREESLKLERNLGRGMPKDTYIRGKNSAKRKTEKKSRMTFLLLVFFPACSLFFVIFPHFPCLFSVSFFFSLLYTRTPVSWTFDKYLHEFRATARKLERESDARVDFLKFFGIVPWLVSSLLLLLHFPRFSSIQLFSSHAAFSWVSVEKFQS